MRISTWYVLILPLYVTSTDEDILALKPLFFHGIRRDSDTVPVLEENSGNREVVECTRWKVSDYVDLLPGKFQRAKTVERMETINTANRSEWGC